MSTKFSKDSCGKFSTNFSEDSRSTFSSVWKPLNKFYMDCMRRVIGAHKSASSFGVLVRMGVFPLQYEFAFRAVLWYLKIFRGDSDPVLTKQLEQLRFNDESFVLSCFYRQR